MTQANKDQVVDLTADVDYQPQGIVSRVVLKQSSGSVTAFAFDAGQELSEHTCPYDALLYLVAGEGTVNIGGTAYSLSAGQMIHLPAHVPHAVSAPQRFKMLLTMLRAEEE